MLKQHNTPSIDADKAAAFAQSIQGNVILPQDAGYDEARAVWNGMIDRYPAIIVQVTSAQDVVKSVIFARNHKLPIAVRGGGHNVAGHATVDHGIIIDMAPMNQVEIDVEKRVAYVGGGATWGEVDAVTQQHGLVTPGGVFSGTGIAGLTLGGGFGWLTKKFGLACDNLIGAEVVTADGRIIHTSDTENSDLIWGLRGGGGNFGIVTRFEYQLHPLGPEVMFVFALHDAEGEKANRALRFFRDFNETAPDEVSSVGFLGIIPENEHMPAEIHGRRFAGIGALYAGNPEEGQRILQPLLDFGEPLVDASGIMPYVDAQKAFDEEYPDGLRYYWKSLNLNALTDEIVDRIVENAYKQPSPLSTTDIWFTMGGAVREKGAETSAYHGRDIAYLINPEANWVDSADDEANIAWVREFLKVMEPFSDGGRYLNFPGFMEEGDAMIKSAYGPNYERLAELKAKYDPQNVFSRNQNVKPKTR